MGDLEHQGDLRESLLHTSGAQSDGLTMWVFDTDCAAKNFTKYDMSSSAGD